MFNNPHSVALSIRKLTEHDVTDQFDCGDSSLNVYIQKNALREVQEGLSEVYVLVDKEKPEAVFGYYALRLRRIPKIGGLLDTERSVVVLERLAVHRESQKRGMGELLLGHAIHTALRVGQSKAVALVAETVPSTLVGWFEQFGFVVLKGSPPNAQTRKMLIDLRIVKSLVRPAPVQ